jgi:RAD51-like protein 2
VPGVGKTQLSIQLALDVQIPACFPQGINGKCIYIDTEGSFHIERAHTMAEAVSQHLKKTMYGKRKPDGTYELEPNIKAARESAVLQYTTEQFLDGIYLIRAHDSTELLAVVNRLPSLMDQILNVKLILIDSIAFPFRQRLHDVATRTRLIAGIALTLQKIAHERQVAVVVTNHVTSKFNKNKGQKHYDEDRAPDEFENVIIADSSIRDIFNTSTELLPALGDTWSHAVTNRMMMHFHKGDRCASLMKSSSLKCSSCVFTITEDGIRDIHKKNEQSKKICT